MVEALLARKGGRSGIVGERALTRSPVEYEKRYFMRLESI